MEESSEESQAPAAAAAAPGLLPLPPPGPLPPPATDDGYLELLGVLRLRARGLPAWMLPPYIHFDVDVYGFHPQELLDAYPSATAADGSSAVFFVNLVRPKTATDSRKQRAVPGGAWRSWRCPVPLVSDAIEGTRQPFTFTVVGSEGEEIRPGYIMQEITLAGDEGKLDGGSDLAVSKIYPRRRGDKAKPKEKPVRTPRKRRRILGAAYSAPVQQAAAAAFSSAPALRLGSSSPLRLGASTSFAPPLRLGACTSSAPPLRLGASTSSGPPLGQGAASTSSGPPLAQGSASTSSGPPLAQGSTSTSSSHGRRLLLLEVADFPPVGEGFLPMRIYRASELVGGRRVPIDCDDLSLLQKKKRLATDISFTYKELNTATFGFPRDQFLGEGLFGKVYKGVLNGHEVAIKILNPHGSQGNTEFRTEVMVLSRMNHPNLVKLVGFCADDGQRLLVYEFMPLGSLETHIFDPPPDKRPLDWNTRIKILAGAAQGLNHLHVNCNPPVINRDVKCANILLGEGYHPKLADFGLAKLGPTGDDTHVSTRVMGTPGYCAPEYLESGQLTINSDVYSFGVVILEVVTGRKALDQSRIRAERSLAEWAIPLIDRRDFGVLIDPALGNQYSVTSLIQILTIARKCLNTTVSQRPQMRNVAAALTYISESEEYQSVKIYSRN